MGEGIAAAADGSLVVASPAGEPRPAGSQRLGPDGLLYQILGSKSQVASFGGSPPASKAIAENVSGNELVVAHNGNIYVTSTAPDGAKPDVWLIRPNGDKVAVDTGIRSATGVTLSPDQSLLYVADGGSRWIYSFHVLADGTLEDRQRYYWLHEADTEDSSDARGMCCDQAGWLYVATGLGIQVCDQTGRVNLILPVPGGRVTDVCFGGEHFDLLYVSCGGKIYQRKLSAKGSNPWAAPTLPSVPHL